MASGEEVLTFLRRHVEEGLVLVFINALIAETIDGTKGVMELYAL